MYTPARMVVAVLAFETLHLVSGTTYYVSLSGSDTASGTRTDPFSTVQHCAKVAPAGSMCLLAGGRYDRDVDLASPIAVTQDITIAGDPLDSSLPVLDGSAPVNTTWTASQDNKCVYQSAPLAQAVWQLWATGVREPPPPSVPSPSYALDNHAPLTPARFPNAKLSDDSVFNSAPGKNSSFLYSSKQSKSGLLVDDGSHEPTLASSGIDATGLIAVLPLGTMGMFTQGVKVQKHIKGASQFSYRSPQGTAGKGHLNIPYFFEGL